jgi:hypothetical protein
MVLNLLQEAAKSGDTRALNATRIPEIETEVAADVAHDIDNMDNSEGSPGSVGIGATPTWDAEGVGMGFAEGMFSPLQQDAGLGPAAFGSALSAGLGDIAAYTKLSTMSLDGNLTPGGATPTGGITPFQSVGGAMSMGSRGGLGFATPMSLGGMTSNLSGVGSALGASALMSTMGSALGGRSALDALQTRMSANPLSSRPSAAPGGLSPTSPLMTFSPAQGMSVGFGSPLSPVTAYGNTSAYQSPQSPFS